MKTSVLLDFVVPLAVGLFIFGAMSFIANNYILNPNLYDYGIVWSASTAAVTATVKAQNISVTVGDGAINYGVIALGNSQDTITLGDTQTATNDGNVTEDFNVKGTDTADWVLATSAAGPDEYLHEFAGDSSFATLDQETFKLARDAVPAGSSATLDFRITVPTSDSSGGATQNANITIQATAN